MNPPQTADRRPQPPIPEPLKRFIFPAFEVHRLDNGLEVYVARYARGPLIHQELVLSGGAQNDDLARAGLTSLTASMLDEGTTIHTAQQIAREVDRMGSYLSSQSDWDAIGVSFGSLCEHFEHGLQLIAEVVTSASFPPHELQRLRDQQLAQLRRRRAQPSSQAADALAELIYAGTIYSRPLLGTQESISGLDRNDILAAAARHTSPRAAGLVLVGDLDPERCFEAVEAAFADWTGSPPPVARDLRPAAASDIRIHLVDRPKAPQTELWMGHPGVPKDHPDRPGLAVLNSLLGGKFTSRLNLNLRERLGITYGVSSSFSQRRGPGPFVVEASVDSSAIGTAVTQILEEMRLLQDELIAESELADTRSYLIGVFPYSLQRIEGLADRLGDLAVYDLPPTYFSDFFDGVAAVTREQIRDLARRHLQPDRMAVAVVGPGAELEHQLASLGELRISPFEGPSTDLESSP